MQQSKNAEMEIPEPMVDTQASQMLMTFAQRIMQSGTYMEQYFQFTGMTADKMMEEMKPQALKRIQTRLVLEKIAEVENIQPSQMKKLTKRSARWLKHTRWKLTRSKNCLVSEIEQMKKDMAVQKAVTLM